MNDKYIKLLKESCNINRDINELHFGEKYKNNVIDTLKISEKKNEKNRKKIIS